MSVSNSSFFKGNSSICIVLYLQSGHYLFIILGLGVGVSVGTVMTCIVSVVMIIKKIVTKHRQKKGKPFLKECPH